MVWGQNLGVLFWLEIQYRFKSVYQNKLVVFQIIGGSQVITRQVSLPDVTNNLKMSEDFVMLLSIASLVNKK